MPKNYEHDREYARILLDEMPVRIKLTYINLEPTIAQGLNGLASSRIQMRANVAESTSIKVE